MSLDNSIAPARIGTGMGYFVTGGILLAFGIFAALAASGGGTGAAGIATICFTLGGGLIAIGFWISLFGRLEQRLIDIQSDLRAGRKEANDIEMRNEDRPGFG